MRLPTTDDAMRRAREESTVISNSCGNTSPTFSVSATRPAIQHAPQTLSVPTSSSELSRKRISSSWVTAKNPRLHAKLYIRARRCFRLLRRDQMPPAPLPPPLVDLLSLQMGYPPATALAAHTHSRRQSMPAMRCRLTTMLAFGRSHRVLFQRTPPPSQLRDNTPLLTPLARAAKRRQADRA